MNKLNYLLILFREWFAQHIYCNHPDNCWIDVGDEDRGADWYCGLCMTKIGAKEKKSFIETPYPYILILITLYVVIYLLNL